MPETAAGVRPALSVRGTIDRPDLPFLALLAALLFVVAGVTAVLRTFVPAFLVPRALVFLDFFAAVISYPFRL